jgi:uncharacterized protein
VIVVVSDTSPIRALEFLGVLDILEKLFGEVFVTPAVVCELKNSNKRFRPIDPAVYSYFKIASPQNNAKVGELTEKLDKGEAESIALALEKHADFILIDESSGRKIAKEMGIVPLGVVGILLRAKELKHIKLLAPLLEKLHNELGFFLSQSLCEEILRRAGE